MVELSSVGRRIAAQSIAIKKYLPLKTSFQSAISQCQQSTITPTSLRSTQTCSGRSSAVQVTIKVEWVVREEMVVHWVLSLKINFQTSSAKSNNLRLKSPPCTLLKPAAVVRVGRVKLNCVYISLDVFANSQIFYYLCDR